MTPSENLRRTWLAQLAVLCSPAFAKEATSALMVMLPDLAEYDDRYFTDETRRYVARAPRRQSVPSYDEICRAFGEWWKSTLPRHRLLAGPGPVPEPDRVPPTRAEIAQVERLLAEVGTKFPTRRPAAVRDAGPLPAVPAGVRLARDNDPIVFAARRQRHAESTEQATTASKFITKEKKL